uniref:Gag-Pol polyprotein n=1 Tax=Schistosoma japonicum TaxID=6182 RepID=C7C201_SCHJA|nr:Gag-Pol polyprotein [Schistosoma japonicum]
MNITLEQLEAYMERQEKRFEQSQIRIMETLMQKMLLNQQNRSSSELQLSHNESVINSINEFHFDGAAGVTFDSWFKKYEDMFRIDLCRLDDASKVRVLLRKPGTVEHERYSNFILLKNPRDFSFDKTIQTLSQIFGEQSSLFNIRYQCLKITKEPGDDWVKHVGIVNRECERFKLSSMTEDQFKYLIFVCSLHSPEDADIRTRILSKLEHCPNMTLQEVTTDCQRLVNSKHDTSLIESGNRLLHVNTVERKDLQGSGAQNHRNDSSKPPSPCWLCGEWHFKRFCPFKNHRCTTCFRKGHKENRCKTRKHCRPKGYSKRFKPRTAKVTVALNKTGSHNRRKYVSLKINGYAARLQLDTASDITLISRRTWDKIGRPRVYPTQQTARSASGGMLNIAGEIHCQVTVKEATETGVIFLTERPSLDLLGLDWIEKLKLMDRIISIICNNVSTVKVDEINPNHELLKRRKMVFSDGLGECTKFQATLTLRQGVKPVFRPKRLVPYAALPVVEQELERLQKIGVIEPVNFSEWAAPIVVVKKTNGSVRLCADYSTGLNEALETHQYPLPLPEYLFAKLNGGKLFAKLDLSEAYLQIPVADKCKDLLTINTHKGLFRYNRPPFGVKMAPSIFQQVVDSMLQDLPGAAAYLDDIIIMGVDKMDLEKKLDQVLSRIDEYGFWLRAEKCNFCMQRVRYLGFIIDKDGRRPDPENIQAVKAVPRPTDVPTLRSFLGLLSHYGAFIPDLHRLRAPLNNLLAKNVKWDWSESCQSAFEKIKKLLVSDLLLTHYDPTLPIVVASDASNYGIGAVISHIMLDGSEKAISHAARSLTTAERNYSQIEKEALSIIFAVKKFHKMIFGRQFTLLTDHKPLLAIFGSKKGIPVYTANRLQRWGTTLLGYDFKIKYQPTTDFGQADALSRLIGSQANPAEDTLVAAVETETEVRRVLEDALDGLLVTFKAIKEATEDDRTLREIRGYLLTNWPNRRFQGEILQYFRRRDSLMIVDSCIMFGDRIVVPKTLRLKVLKQFHSGHPGINKMKPLARSYAYWPTMDQDIETRCRNCSLCLQAAESLKRCEPQEWKKPNSPWERLHADFAGPVRGKMFLVVVDALTKWPQVYAMTSCTASETINKLSELFSYFGVPETLVTDNCSQFASESFKHFCRFNGITHVRSPPCHPQSNGQAECFVDKFKRSSLKGGEEETSQEITKFLTTYRITPNPIVPAGKSPAEAMFGKRVRTIFDVMLPRKLMDSYSQNKTIRSLNVGDKVLVKSYHGPKRWEPGIIEKKKEMSCTECVERLERGSDTSIRYAEIK